MKKILAILVIVTFVMTSTFAAATTSATTELESKSNLQVTADLSLAIEYDSFAGQYLGFAGADVGDNFGTDQGDFDLDIPTTGIGDAITMEVQADKTATNTDPLFWYYVGMNKNPMTLTITGPGLNNGSDYIDIKINNESSNKSVDGTFVSEDIPTGFNALHGELVVTTGTLTSDMAGKTWTTTLTMTLSSN